MNKIGAILLHASVALYLFANGILGITKGDSLRNFRGGEFGSMVETIFGKGDFSNVLTIVLAVIAIGAGVFLLLSFFRIEIPVTDLILLVFICLWVAFIVIVDIIDPLQNKNIKFTTYLLQLSPHLMVLGAFAASTKRFS